MKFNKKFNLIAAFVVGAILFTGAAFAEVKTLSGYEQLKEAVKSTIQAEDSIESFTRTSKVTVKHNDKLIMEMKSTEKRDNKKDASEYSSETIAAGQKIETRYSYEDKKQNITYYDYDDTWFVYEKPQIDKDFYQEYEYDYRTDSQFKALEKLADAGVSAFNLQNVLNAEKDSDGKTVLSGSLTEGQIHPFINALFSFLFSQTYNYNIDSENSAAYPKFDGDVYIKSASARIKLNDDKSIEDIYLTAVITGRDTKGEYHDLNFESEIAMTDINKTVVEAPDLTGKNVVYEKNDFINGGVSKAYIGKYKSDIVEYKDDTFTKIGERYLEITDIDEKVVKARVYSMIGGEQKDYTEFEAAIESQNWATAQIQDFYVTLSFNNDGTIDYYDGQKEETHFVRIYE